MLENKEKIMTEFEGEFKADIPNGGVYTFDQIDLTKQVKGFIKSSLLQAIAQGKEEGLGKGYKDGIRDGCAEEQSYREDYIRGAIAQERERVVGELKKAKVKDFKDESPIEYAKFSGFNSAINFAIGIVQEPTEGQIITQRD